MKNDYFNIQLVILFNLFHGFLTNLFFWYNFLTNLCFHVINIMHKVILMLCEISLTKKNSISCISCLEFKEFF